MTEREERKEKRKNNSNIYRRKSVHSI